MKPFLLVFFAPLLSLCWSHARAEVPWHLQFSGAAAPIHRVVLKGQSSMERQQRDSLVKLHQACLAMDPRARGTPAPMPGTVLHEVPDLVSPLTVELYYSPHQTLQITHTATHTVNLTTCEIVGVYNTVAALFSAQGECRLASADQPSQGYCNERLNGMTLPRPNLSPDIARQMEQQMKTDEVRSFLGLPCEVKRLTYANEEKCIAKPPATAQPGSVFASPMHLHLPGLLLQARGNAANLTATEVQLSQAIPLSIFDIGLTRQALKKLTGQRTL